MDAANPPRRKILKFLIEIRREPCLVFSREWECLERAGALPEWFPITSLDDLAGEEKSDRLNDKAEALVKKLSQPPRGRK
jgi:hypothetical protein